MEWTDEGIVLGIRRHGEANAIVELLTHAHGRHLGLVRGGAGARLRPVLQPGNTLRAVWRARLDEHLGNYVVEGLSLRASTLLSLPHALFAATHLAGLARLLPERDPHQSVYEMLEAILDHLDDPRDTAAAVIRFEMMLLAELGFGLELGRCAATGTTGELAYVSPKSGGAVSRAAGEAWRDRLLRLPPFLREGDAPAGEAHDAPTSDADLHDGFAITGLFLNRHVFEPRGLVEPSARQSFIDAVMRAGARSPQPAAP
jgi:DNA repair protein RecO (recombination protein O)